SSFDFRSIPGRSAVVVNVTGRQAVGISPLSVGFNGDRADAYTSAHFGEAASRILYNFEAVGVGEEAVGVGVADGPPGVGLQVNVEDPVHG
ncbi:hypothetical protein EAO70_35550, partial [Streptomyces sp. adm13(2018)]|uniref:hypothetical protein n=1 Tax=Streptomyces sp. adm13(2018) TaxID=2479007 RepID=UPI0013A3A955